MIDLITLCTSAVWRLTKLFLSLIVCGICFVIFMFMLICVLIIIFGSNTPTIWGKDLSEK